MTASTAPVGSMLVLEHGPLGVTDFGESGRRDQLCSEAGIDAASICLACFAALA